MVGLVIAGVLFLLLVSYAYLAYVDMLKQQDPDYKGKDFFNSDYKHPEWDENRSHTENF